MFCQSCTLPIDNIDDRGSEKDGSKSDIYCKYCYKDGAFTDPGMTLERMTDIAKSEMKSGLCLTILFSYLLICSPR